MFVEETTVGGEKKLAVWLAGRRNGAGRLKTPDAIFTADEAEEAASMLRSAVATFYGVDR